MRRRFDSEIPQAYARLCEMRAAARTDLLTVELGELARALAASRPGGVFLCTGDGAGEPGAWMLDGMDLSSRLVVVVGDRREAERLRAVLGDDLRVTVHRQDAVAFLEDVHDHRFDLIADLSAEPPARRLELALARLAPGGLFLTRCPADVVEASLGGSRGAGAEPADTDTGAFVPARFAQPLDATLIARRPQPPAGKRRGGRRARAGVTPLFSSKTR